MRKEEVAKKIKEFFSSIEDVVIIYLLSIELKEGDYNKFSEESSLPTNWE